MQSELKPITKESASDKLAEAMYAAIKRLETIQETHAEICLGDDLAHYRTALALYRRIPSFAQREAAWNTRPTTSNELVEKIETIIRTEQAKDTDCRGRWIFEAANKIAALPQAPTPKAASNELPADTEEQIARVLFSFIEDEVSFDEAKAANDAGYSWVSDMARAALAKLSAMPSGWMPIETAPKDGTPILLAAKGFDGGVGIAAFDTGWSPDGWWMCDDGKRAVDLPLRGADPTHWQPLPTPPEGEK